LRLRNVRVVSDDSAPIGLTPSRVVAGEDSSGRAVVLSRRTPDALVNFRGVEIAELWRFGAPATQATDGGDVDPAAWQLLSPPVGAMTWRVVRFTEADPTLHRTPTIDLVLVTEGQIDLVLEDGSTRLRVGDTAVIQGCMHGWRLVDDIPCTMVATMITVNQGDADP
jgi:hypothetical protein